MPTKRRQLAADFTHPPDLTPIIELADEAADYEFYGDADQYAHCIGQANRTLNRFERGFFAGFLAARRSERP